ncbi:MAG TPA: carbohydrate ABC transporter permease [Caldilineaceae bacterium]|nr:carbohydrate ABC transporter permease [Caldilineaceae bacterium]
MSGTLRLGKLFALLFFLLPAIFISIFPLIVMISTSFKTSQEVYIPPPTFLPRAPTLQNYVDIWHVAPLGTYFRNSLIIGLGSTLVALALAIPAAYALARFRFRGKQLYMLSLLGIQMFPPIVIVLGLFRLVAALNMVDNLATLVVLSAVFSLSFAIWLLTSYFATIPKEIEEAAMMDGNSRIGAMLQMVLPLSWPGIVAVAIFGFMNGWNEFLFALTFLRNQDKLPLTIGLFKFVTRFQVQWHQLMAASFLTTIVVVVLFMLIQKQLTRGMVALGEK